MKEEPKIKMCKGIPENLMLLAFILRNFKWNEIVIQLTRNIGKHLQKQELIREKDNKAASF